MSDSKAATMQATRRLLALQKSFLPGAFKQEDKVDLPSGLPSHGRTAVPAIVLPDGTRMTVERLDGDQLVECAGTVTVNDTPIGTYKQLDDRPPVRLILSALGTQFEERAHHLPEYPVLEIAPAPLDSSIAVVDLWAIIYLLFTLHHVQEHVPIVFSERLTNVAALVDYLLRSGLGRNQIRSQNANNASSARNILFLSRMTFWQAAGTMGFHRRGWLAPSDWCHVANNDASSSASLVPSSLIPFPYSPSFTRNELVITAHPLRPPKPQPGDLLYRRHCPSVNKTLEFRYFCLEDTAERSFNHLEAFNRWHNNPRVNAGWGESGSIEYHRAYITKIHADPAVMPVMMSWDGELMGYLEIVWVKENHMATYIGGGDSGGQARDWDRALHILVGEDHFKGKLFSRAWLRSAFHYAFLADPRTERVFGEPRLDNDAVLQTIMNAGMHIQTVFDFPYKRSALVMVPRERFFKMDLL